MHLLEVMGGGKRPQGQFPPYPPAKGKGERRKAERGRDKGA
jgi:hypothetical protein